jgi:hypothetical protein
MPILSDRVMKEINLQYYVYAYNNPGVSSGYSLLGNSTQSTPTYFQELTSYIYTAPEFAKLSDSYNFVSLKSIDIKINVVSNYSSSQLQTVPPIFVKPYVGTSQSLSTYTAIAYADDSLESQNNRTVVRRYDLPPLMVGDSGYITGGTNAYIACKAWSAVGGMYWAMGYIRAPTFENNASAYVIPVYAVDVVANVEFAGANLFNS